MLPTELYSQLMRELGLSLEQAEGATGALLCLARANLSQDEFQKVADAIPAISDVMGKSPRFEIHPQPKIKVQLSRLLGGLGKLAPLARPLLRLHVDKQVIPLCAKVLTAHVSEECRSILEHSWN